MTIAIIGSGFGGLCAAIKLKQAGENDFVILEKASRVGGTWRENTYPGAACDVQSHMYSYSFEPNPNWSRMFSKQAEILAYIESLVEKYQLRPHLRFHAEVTAAVYRDFEQEWEVEINGHETLVAKFVIAAMGPLHIPSIPSFEGQERFQGETWHSATWKHDHDLTGKRVAVIGNGSSATQFVPQIVKKAGQLTVFQRTPHWLLPKVDRKITGLEKLAMKYIPGVHRLYRNFAYWVNESSTIMFMNGKYIKPLQKVAELQLKRQVKDPELRAKLTPDFTIGCKRILIASDYYPALQRENAALVTENITEFTEKGIRTADGREHEFDVIIYGTGFKVTDAITEWNITGKNGMHIGQAMAKGPEAYMGTVTHGFPNMFLIVGPNAGGGNQSIVFTIEADVRYILGCLRLLKATDSGSIEVRKDVQRRWNESAQRKLAKSVWNSGGCKSWYLNEEGRNLAAWPGSSITHYLRKRKPDPKDFVLLPYELEPDEDHRGAAVITSPDGADIDVDVRLRGHMETIDGTYRWYGRVQAHPDVVALHSSGKTQVLVRVGDGEPVPARLAEQDPWGNTRITGTGLPPYPLED
ncbi:DUF4873 domain-containing protein [Pseudonocardiaceae bacterium YIM PH 21723]|nr:DUF4873 domain-containing protein [Pseudonocardiaceae bacterium YIM PH 21723]